LSDQTQSPSAPERTLVLALGNPLRGDDGIGEAVVKQLRQSDLPAGVTALDGGTPGLETILLLQDYSRAIIIDAADMGRRPGEWTRFTTADAELQADDLHSRMTVHYAGLAEALTLGEALDILPPVIIIYGVQPGDIGWTPGLSEPVQAAVPAVCNAILYELQAPALQRKAEYG
jgi:hydrogenase maturation protease